MNTGAPSALAGYQFQLWFVALKAAEAFFDESVEVRPEAQMIKVPSEKNGRLDYKETIAAIDDCIAMKNLLVIHYDLKYIAPKNPIWNLSDLKQEEVLERMFKQFRINRHSVLKFVSKSPCPLFEKAFKSLSSASNENEIKHRLNKKQKEDWDNVKRLLRTTNKQLLEFAKTVEYEYADVDWMRKEIANMFKGHVTNDSAVANALYIYATECSIRRAKINQQSVLNYLKKENIHPQAHLKITDIKESFLRASSSLVGWKNTFGKLRRSQIQREEAQQIVRWVKQDLLDSKDPIKVLVGSAGSGKTVICQQIYQSLAEENIPVIGIKADLVSAKSPMKFMQSLGLQDDLYKLLTSVSSENNRVVVIVDQIDALSLSLSADRSAITTMLNLIQQLLSVPYIRIVVSCREYDLHFDPLLQKYEDQNKVEVKEMKLPAASGGVSSIPQTV